MWKTLWAYAGFAVEIVLGEKVYMEERYHRRGLRYAGDTF